MISSFYQYHSGCVFYYRRIARKAEAGRGGILRSINISATCPAMWRLTFSEGGNLSEIVRNYTWFDSDEVTDQILKENIAKGNLK